MKSMSIQRLNKLRSENERLRDLLKESLKCQYDAFQKADVMKMPDNNIQDIQAYFDKEII